MTGIPVAGNVAPFRVAERVGSASGQGGVAGGPGCVCDSDCGDGNVCTTNTCDLGTGLCSSVNVAGVSCRGAVDPDGLFCTLGVCNGDGTCNDNDAGGSPCDALESCNDVTDNCDGTECTSAAQCPLAGDPGADPALCQVDACEAGRCRVNSTCNVDPNSGERCEAGACVTVLDGRCCTDLALCDLTTLAACDNGGGPGSGPWAVGDGSCQCPKASWGFNDNVGGEFIFSVTASEDCTVGGVTGAANFNRIGDDYTTDNNSFLLLEEFNFIGGVVGDGNRVAVFEFWDGSVDPPVLVDNITLAFDPDQVGVFAWTVTIGGGGFAIPPVGWVTMRPGAGGGETVTWFSTNEIGAIGLNNVNLMWADNERRDVLLPTGPNILAFELIGTKTDPTGACCLGENNCNDTTLNLPWFCEAAGGNFIPGELCSNNPCTTASCCFGDGSCAVLAPASCLAQGGAVFAFGGTCSPNCCGQVASAGDTCLTSTVKLLDTDTAGVNVPISVRYSGDSSAATHGHCSVTTAQTCNIFEASGGPEPDSCPAGESCLVDEACVLGGNDAGHWESFELTAPSAVKVGYCCSDDNDGGNAGVMFIVVVDDCTACTTTLRIGGADAPCSDGNRASDYLLEAGIYHFPVFTAKFCDQPGVVTDCVTDDNCPAGILCVEQSGTYELEVTAAKLPFVTCCLEDICIDELSVNPVTTLGCAALGGFELVGVVSCFDVPGQTPCELGACCVGPGDCRDNTDVGMAIGDCQALGGAYFGGARCVADDPCPICSLDDLDSAGGADCQPAVGGQGWLLASDRATNPPTSMADDFTAVAGGPMTEICFKAVYFTPGAGTCCQDQGLADSWEVTVYEDDGLIPAAQLAGPQILQNIISGDPTACTESKSGSGLVGITLNPGQCYWIEINGFGEGDIGDPPAPGCTTGILANGVGNNYMVQGSPGNFGIGDITTDIGGTPEADFSFCIEGGIAGPGCPRAGACCLDPGPPAICQDDLQPLDCHIAGGLFFPGDACANNPCSVCEAEECTVQISLNQPGESCAGGLPCSRPYSNAFCGPDAAGDPCPGSLGADTWYSYTTSETECGIMTISTCGTGAFDGQMAIYDGGSNCECPTNELVDFLVCDDDACGPGGMSEVVFTATAGTCYIIRLGGWEGSQGASTVSLSMVPDPAGCVPLVAEPVIADDAIDLAGANLACANDAGCAGLGPQMVCRGGFCYAPKGRFVSVSPNPANAGILTARRICVDAPGPGPHCRWVEAPVAKVGNGPGPVPMLVSNSVPGPLPEHFRDWSLDAPDSQGNSIVSISGCSVVNGHTYFIQTLIENTNPADEGNYSVALVLPTVPIFADVDQNDSANIGDVLVVVKGFQGESIKPRTWAKIAPNGTLAADPSNISIPADALLAVKGFQGEEYTEQAGVTGVCTAGVIGQACERRSNCNTPDDGVCDVGIGKCSAGLPASTDCTHAGDCNTTLQDGICSPTCP